jgi:hypothetical protein
VVCRHVSDKLGCAAGEKLRNTVLGQGPIRGVDDDDGNRPLISDDLRPLSMTYR